MINKIPFSIIFENQNIDFFLEAHSETKSPEHLTRISTEILDILDSNVKRNKISDGDLIQAFGKDTGRAIKHYVKHGFTEGRKIDDFDEWQYLASNPSLINQFKDEITGEITGAARHFVETGFNLGLIEDDFDAWQYLAGNDDLITAFGNNTTQATKHYVINGFEEGRVLDGFDGTTYLDNYDDLMNAFAGDVGMAAQHYVNHGFAEGRVFTPLII